MQAHSHAPDILSMMALPMRLNVIALAVSLVPFAAIHLCYALAAWNGHVPWCIPYLEGCSGISATGRQPPESIVFRVTIIPSAALMLVFWPLVNAWLKALGSPSPQLRGLTLLCGVVASLGLIAYASVLGEIGQGFNLQRRIGVRLFFGFTILAQLFMALQVESLGRAYGHRPLARMARLLLGVSAFTILLGLLSLYLWATYDGFKDIEHIFAWWVTFLVLLHPLGVYCMWRETGFQARFAASGR